MSRCKAFVAAGILSLATATSSQAAVMLVNFKLANPGGGGTAGGLFYNNFGSTTSNNPPAITAATVLKDTANTNTDVSMSAPNLGGFLSDDRGNGINFTFNGFTFDGSVMNSYYADNGPSRDGLSVFRLVSQTQYNFNFTIAASYHNSTDGNPPAANLAEGSHEVSYNVGGTYSLATRTFTGGTTATVDAAAGANDQAGAVLSGKSTFVEGVGYVIDLQLGYADTGANGNVAPINAMRIETSPVPEPGTMAALGLITGGMVLRRRRH